MKRKQRQNADVMFCWITVLGQLVTETIANIQRIFDGAAVKPILCKYNVLRSTSSATLAHELVIVHAHMHSGYAGPMHLRVQCIHICRRLIAAASSQCFASVGRSARFYLEKSLNHAHAAVRCSSFTPLYTVVSRRAVDLASIYVSNLLHENEHVVKSALPQSEIISLGQFIFIS